LEIEALIFPAPAVAVDLLEGALAREMLIGTDLTELSFKRLSLRVARIPLTELSELRCIERSQRNARTAS